MLKAALKSSSERAEPRVNYQINIKKNPFTWHWKVANLPLLQIFWKSSLVPNVEVSMNDRSPDALVWYIVGNKTLKFCPKYKHFNF